MISDDNRNVAHMLLGKVSQQLAMARQQLDAARAEVERLEKTTTGLEAYLQGQVQAVAERDTARASTHYGRSVVEHAGGSDSVSASVTRAPKSRNPRGSAAVREIVVQAGPDGIALQDVVEALKSRGWINPDATDPKGSTRVAFSRLRKEDPQFQNLDGRYTFVPNAGGEASP